MGGCGGSGVAAAMHARTSAIYPVALLVESPTSCILP